jgi:regulator of replication initiation timing
MGLKTRPQPSHTLHGFRVVVEISSTYHSLLTQSTPLAHFVILPISLFLHMLYLLCKTTVVLYIVADKLERGNKVVGTPKSHHITQALAHRISPFPFHPITQLSPYTLHLVLQENEKRLYTIEERVIALQTGQAPAFEAVFSKLDTLLEKIDAVSNENTALRAAYNSSKEETAALKAAVDTLTKKLDHNIAISAPPSPDTTASSTSMEEMTMQLSNVHNDIQDVLEAVRNPPGKRKRHTSNQNTEPTTPTPKNRRPATQRPRDASPEHSLMHSRHATTAAQEALDSLMIKYPPRQLATATTSTTPTPPPDGSTTQDTPLPDAPATAPAEKDGWKTVEGKATQRKKKNEEAGKKQAEEMSDKPRATKNGGRGKNSYQPRPKTTSAEKTWADVVKAGGINVQIVLGNDSLGLAAHMKKRGERRGGAARRLARKREDGERGAMARGRDGPAVS